MNIITHHKHKKTIISKDPEDADMSSEGPRPRFEGHQAQTKEEKEDFSSSKKRRNADKAFIAFAFNTLNPLS